MRTTKVLAPSLSKNHGLHFFSKSSLLVSLLMLFLLFFVSFSAAAPPLPHGVSGIIFLPNGQQVPEGTPFQLINLATNEIIEGTTGRAYDSGAYAASVAGNDGDGMLLKAATATHYGNKTFTLQGSMYDVDLVLTEQFPNTPPIIVSDPVVEATALEPYAYEVVVQDNENNLDRLVLVEFPEGMRLNGSTIIWTPTLPGIATVEVRAYDLFEADDIQRFNITVAPNPTSTTTTTTTSTSSGETSSTTTTTLSSSSAGGSSGGSLGSYAPYIYHYPTQHIALSSSEPSSFSPETRNEHSTTVAQSWLVSGYFFLANGKYQVPRGMPFTFKNLNTGEIIKGTTGAGPYPGKYLITIKGKPGDLIKVTMKSFATTITLVGDMQYDFITTLTLEDIKDFGITAEDLLWVNKTENLTVFPHQMSLPSPIHFVAFLLWLFVGFFLLLLIHKRLKQKHDLFDDLSDIDEPLDEQDLSEEKLDAYYDEIKKL